MRRGSKKAIVAVSHKIIIAAYHVLNKKEAYKSPLLNEKKYEEKHKAKSVQKYLIELQKLGFTTRLTPIN